MQEPFVRVWRVTCRRVARQAADSSGVDRPGDCRVLDRGLSWSSGSRALDQASGRLGRLLFWDPILSGNKDVACATCHHPDFRVRRWPRSLARVQFCRSGTSAQRCVERAHPGCEAQFADRAQHQPSTAWTAEGGGRGPVRRGNARSVDQATAPMLWDNRIRSLEAQALEPIKSQGRDAGRCVQRSLGRRRRRGPPPGESGVRRAFQTGVRADTSIDAHGWARPLPNSNAAFSR